MKLLSKWLRKVWTNSSLRKFNGHHHDVLAITEYLCHIWSRIFSVCRSQNPFNLSLFMTYFYVFSINHKTGATSIRTTWLNGSSPFSRAFMFAYSVLFASYFVVHCRVVLFLLAIVLFVLRLTAFHYPLVSSKFWTATQWGRLTRY